MSGKLRRETRLSGRRPQWPARFVGRSTRASRARRSRPSTPALRIAALAKTENSMASPPEPPQAAGNGCNSGSPSSRPLRRRESAPRFLRSSGRPRRTWPLHRPQSETSCPFRSSWSAQNSLFRRPESLPPSTSSARARRTELCGSSGTYPQPSEVSLRSAHPIAIRMS